MREPSQGTVPAHQPKEIIMAKTLGTFTKMDDGVFTGTLSMLNFNGSISIAPVDKKSEDAPDHRVFAGSRQNYEVGAGWSMVAKSSGETYINCKLAAPEFGQHTIYSRLVKLEQPAEDRGTHIMLWEPRS
jgi:uncharacterized protein (DUF736 family)